MNLMQMLDMNARKFGPSALGRVGKGCHYRTGERNANEA